MFSLNYLQTGNSLSWLWLVLVLLLLAGIIWWFSRRSGEPANNPSAAVRGEQAKPVDDLIRIEGIGPKVEKVLNNIGITTFQDLANANSTEIQNALKAAGLQMMNPEGWIEQAALAARGDWEGLERLQAELKGGRKS